MIGDITMPDTTIKKGDTEYAKLLNIWIANGQTPGNLTLRNGKTYTVLQPESGVVKFKLQSNEAYGSMSQGH